MQSLFISFCLVQHQIVHTEMNTAVTNCQQSAKSTSMKTSWPACTATSSKNRQIGAYQERARLPSKSKWMGGSGTITEIDSMKLKHFNSNHNWFISKR
jgi:hypothetical protein